MSNSVANPRALPAILIAGSVYGVWYAMGAGAFGASGGVARGLLLDVITRVLLPLVALALLYKLNGVRPRDCWVVSPFKNRSASEVIAVAFISTVLLLTYVIVANVVAGDELVRDDRLENAHDFGAIASLSIILYLSAAASFSEEFFYRALPRLVFGSAHAPASTIAYVLVSSAVFGFMHASYGTNSAIAAGYFGLVAALILVYTNNLWYLLVGHFLSDVLLMWWRYAKFGALPV